MKRWIPVFVMVLALLMSQPGARIASAQSDSVWLAVSPVDITVDISPGQMAEKAVTVTNKDAVRVPVRVAAPILQLVKMEDGRYRFDTDPNGSERGVRVAADSVDVIDGFAGVTLKVTVTAGRDAEPGTHYRGVLVESFDPGAPSDAQTVRTSVLVPVIINVAGQANDSGRLATFKPVRLVSDGLPVEFDLEFENTGNVTYRAGGRVEIVDSKGRMVGEQRIEAGNVFPRMRKALKPAWTESKGQLPPYGTYTAKATVYYGRDGRQKAEREATFRVVPYSLLKIAGAAVGVTAAGTAAVFLLLGLARRGVPSTKTS